MLSVTHSNIFGESYPKTSPHQLNIYCDEIKKEKNVKGENWFYLGMLLIPESTKDLALKKLNGARKLVEYERELHFRNLTNFSYANIHNQKTLLAKEWLKLLFNDKNEKLFYFNILGINNNNLKWGLFGENKRDLFTNAYNRFFRILLKSSLYYFFPNKEIEIVNIFHDEESALQNHFYFNWHSINRLSKEMPNVTFKNDQILFVKSNHHLELNYPQDSHFIQLIDLILGATRQALDGTCKKDGCCEIAKIFSELLIRMRDKKGNKNSSYGYFRKYSFSFFPKQTSTLKDFMEDSIDNPFYTYRKLLLLENQPSLFE